MPSQPNEIDRAQLVDWLREHVPTIEAIYLFGSALHGPWRAESDLDVAIDSGMPLDPRLRHELALTLANAMNRDVDLVDLRTANTVFRREILTTGERLFVRDPARQDALEAAMLAEYLDFNFTRRAHVAEMVAEGRVHGR
jgi:predicted nucleotidyltransferase